MKLTFDLRVISIALVIGCASIVFMWTATDAPLANGAAPVAAQTTPTPCASPNPVSKFASNPAVIQVDTTNDIFAVGDAHADPGRLAGVLVKAGIISAVPSTPSAVTWTAGPSVVVVTGDMIDKGPDSLGVIALLRALQTAAAAQGGQVIITMGNHEAEFLADPHGKKTKEFQDELKKAGLKRNDVASCQGDLGIFLCGLPIAARVNDWFFSHAGNTNGQTIPQLNAAIASGICQSGFATPQLQDYNSILEARLNDKGPNNLPWFDNGSTTNNPQTLLQSYVTALGVNHLIQGHQPGKVAFPDGVQRNEYYLFQRYGLLFLIDGGMSVGISGNKSVGGALHITRSTNQGATIQTVTAICAGGQTTVLWDSQTNQPGPIALQCPSPTPTPTPSKKR
jgi:hypothetical protein